MDKKLLSARKIFLVCLKGTSVFCFVKYKAFDLFKADPNIETKITVWTLNSGHMGSYSPQVEDNEHSFLYKKLREH